MGNVVLHDHADRKEGVVKTKTWGACTSDTCQHVSHDPLIRYFITEINGSVVWEGEHGEYIVQSSETGRCFFTEYKDRGNYIPYMCTIELETMAGRPIIPLHIWRAFIVDYGSLHHEVLVRLMAFTEIPA
jgi:hypothetical protein